MNGRFQEEITAAVARIGAIPPGRDWFGPFHAAIIDLMKTATTEAECHDVEVAAMTLFARLNRTGEYGEGWLHSILAEAKPQAGPLRLNGSTTPYTAGEERSPQPKPNGHAAEAPSHGTAGIPFLVTGDMKRRLREIGYADEQIADMKPADAWQILNASTETISPRTEQRSGRGNYDLNELRTELRNALNRATASLVVAKRDSVQVLKLVRAGAASLVEFDYDPGFDIAVAHLLAVARDHYSLSVDDIQGQISTGIQDGLERRARAQAKSGGKQQRQQKRDAANDTEPSTLERQQERNVQTPPVESEDHGLPTSEDAVWSSEDALALQFAGQYLDDLRFVAAWSRWLRYNNDDGRWRTDERLETFDDARKICRGAALQADEPKARMRLSSKSTVAAVEYLARSDQRLAASVDQWDRDPWLLNTPAGTVNLKTGATHGHRPEDYITKVAATSPGGKCDLWRKFIETVAGGDTDLAGFIQRMLGYSLTGSTREQCLFFLYGLGANGKSVLLNTVSSILADYHATAPIETFTASVTDRHPTDLAGLRGARVVTAIETEEGRRWAEAKIKSLTGGDPIPARFMRQDFFTFTPQFKLIVAGNHKPSLRTVDEAIRRRFHLVPCTVTIPPAQRDKDLPNKLKAEWPGILQWMIDGCLIWQSQGLNPPAAVREATATYLEAEDAIGAWIMDCCARDPNAWSSSTALFGSWSAWATKTGESIGSQKIFSQKLENQAGVMKHSTNAGKGFYGLRIKLTYAD